MADSNAITLDAASWLPTAQWRSATAKVRDRYLARVGELAVDRKRRELRLGIGADGKPLAKVQPSSRPDGADGKPLDPHYGQSRSVRWLRSSKGKGHVTLWWSHGWGRILGYHADGKVPGAPVRDVIGLTAASLTWLKNRARQFWRAITGRGPALPSAPATPQTPAPVNPHPLPAPVLIPVPLVPPIAARPSRRGPVELPAGARPDLRSRRIQVIRGTP